MRVNSVGLGGNDRTGPHGFRHEKHYGPQNTSFATSSLTVAILGVSATQCLLSFIYLCTSMALVRGSYIVNAPLQLRAAFYLTISTGTVAFVITSVAWLPIKKR